MKEVEFTDLHASLEEYYDVFIASASFEERCLSVVKNIYSEVKFGKKFVLAEGNNRNIIQHNLEIFQSKYNFNVIEVDSVDQLQTVDNILVEINVILNANPNSSFLIDITTFTRQNLLILIRLLRNNLNSTNNLLQCLYSKALDYAVDLPEEDKWLSKGVMSVQSVFGYVGSMLPSRPYHLIILMGYDVDRAVSLIEAYEPSRITVGIGSPSSSLSTRHYELNKKRCGVLMEEFPLAENFEFSCSSSDAVDVILAQAQKYPNFNVVVTPMNNKISTFFLAAASFKNKNMQIAIATPLLYNYLNYSTPGNSCFIIDAAEFILKDS